MHKVLCINIVWLLSAGGYRHWQQQIFIHLLRQRDTCTKNLHLINWSSNPSTLPKSGMGGERISCTGDIREDMLARIHNDSSSGTCISSDLWRKNILKINRYDTLCHIQWGLKGGWQTATDGHLSGTWHFVSQDLKAAAKTKSRGKIKRMLCDCTMDPLSVCSQELYHWDSKKGNTFRISLCIFFASNPRLGTVIQLSRYKKKQTLRSLSEWSEWSHQCLGSQSLIP